MNFEHEFFAILVIQISFLFSILDNIFDQFYLKS